MDYAPDEAMLKRALASLPVGRVGPNTAPTARLSNRGARRALHTHEKPPPDFGPVGCRDGCSAGQGR